MTTSLLALALVAWHGLPAHAFQGHPAPDAPEHGLEGRGTHGLEAHATMTISVRLDQPGAKVSKDLYGIFFEEINQAGDGGIYGEMLSNRGLEAVPSDAARAPVGWRLGSATVVPDGPNAAHPRSFAIPSGESVANTGFGGLSVEKGQRYRVVVWAKGPGKVGVGFGQKPIDLGRVGDGWKRLERTIKAGGTAEGVNFTVSAMDGAVNVAYASLMPEKLWKGRRNGMREDLAQKVDAMKPAFVRFPGGCYVEGGDRFEDAFDWRRSIGPVEGRKGLAHSMWGYPNTFGLGYHEYLQWCEDMGSVPLFVVNAGLNHQQEWPMDDMGHWVEYALDAIEYANGPVTSKWGAERARNGHPKPFGLKYVEIGNENGGWAHGGNAAYAPRYRMIYDAIKARHPEITTISNWPIDQPMEMVDEHYYADPAFFWRNTTKYDAYDRKGPKIYVGEYAVTQGSGEGNLAAALGEAAFMAGMERNSDVVTMSSYAPLFVNVANRQWNPNAIVFNSRQAYGTPSYHVQSIFANNRPDRNVAVSYPLSIGAPPKLGGSVGLMTWATQAEFKDVRLDVRGSAPGKSGPLAGTNQTNVRGEWTSQGDTFRQKSLDTDRVMTFAGTDTTGADGYTLSLKARKVAGGEGFIVRFDEHDGHWMQWNLGGWGNKETAFQRDGAVVSNRLPQSIETDRWYDVRIEREGNTMRGYLDGKLVQEYREGGIPDLTAVAGVDEGARELVIKVVNGSDEARTASLDLTGGKVGGIAKAIVLTGPSLLTENTFAAPNAVAPKASTMPWTGSYTFAPRSVTVLRLSIR